MVGWSVAKAAKCMLRENNRFMLEFDLTVAKVAEVAGLSGVEGPIRCLIYVCSGLFSR